MQLRIFLLSKGIAVGSVLNHSSGVYMLQVASPRAVLAAAKAMVSVCFKKRRELQIVIDYYENGITGTAALSGLNELVRAKVRLGKIRPLISLPKYSEGMRGVARSRGLKSAEARKAKKTRVQA